MRRIPLPSRAVVATGALTVLVLGAGVLGATDATASPVRELAPAARVGGAAPAGEVTPVPQLTISRYLGDWYQVAAVPAIYEVQCAKDSKAHYVLDSPGVIGVTNTCTTWWGSTSTVTGKARVDNAPRNSALSVSFLNLFGHQVYTGTNYVVFGLDKDYGWALVGDPARRSGFVLSRKPALTAAQTATVKARIAAAGYESCAFKVTPVTGGLSTSAGYC